MHKFKISWYKSLVSVVSVATKKMSPKKEYVEMEGYFYLGTHIKCAGSVTFILL